MKKVTVYYTAERDGEPGEACLDIEMEDRTAETLETEYGRPSVFLAAGAYVESMLQIAEKLRGRRYVPGSIKCIRGERGTT